MDLAARFSMNLPSSLRALASDPTLPEVLAALVADARAAWPGIDVDDHEFVAALAARIPEDVASGVVAALRTVRASDLYLARACLRGHPRAIAALDAISGAEVERARPRFRWLAHDIDDVKQRLRERLLVATTGEDGQTTHPPKIADYGGTGELKMWLRVSVTRMLLNVATRESREVPEEDAFFEAITDGAATAESHYVRAQGQAELKAALVGATARLASRDACLLRYAYADKRTVEQIGAIYGVHGATASRWVQRARRALLVEVRAELMEKLSISDEEAASLVRAALSHVDLTLSAVFGER